MYLTNYGKVIIQGIISRVPYVFNRPLVLATFPTSELKSISFSTSMLGLKRLWGATA